MKKSLSLNLLIGCTLAFVLCYAQAVEALTQTNKNNVLDLLVLDRLFASESLLGTAPNQFNLAWDKNLAKQPVLQSGLRLGDLIVLDNLFSNNSPILNQSKTTLGDLLILDQLFTNQPLLAKNKTHPGLSLGELFILDKLFRESNQPLLERDQTSLGDLFLLTRLFNWFDLFAT